MNIHRAFCAVPLLLLALSCNTSGPMTSNAGETPAPLSISLTTEGGLMGRGLGSITIEGNDVTGSDMRHSCKGTLSSSEQKTLHDAVSHAKPSAWKKDYSVPDNPHGHGDQVRYTLTMGATTTSWIDSSSLPKDLAALRDIVWRIRERVAASCP